MIFARQRDGRRFTVAVIVDVVATNRGEDDAIVVVGQAIDIVLLFRLIPLTLQLLLQLLFLLLLRLFVGRMDMVVVGLTHCRPRYTPDC